MRIPSAILIAVLTASAAAQSLPDGLSASDWSGIRAAHDAQRLAAVAVGGGFEARNTGQQWTARFDGSGFEVTPEAGGWSWGLSLGCWGRDGAQGAAATSNALQADGGRVECDRGAGLAEWWVNDGRGLEHGFTVCERPAGDGALTLALAVRGTLQPVAAADGRRLTFVDDAGAAVVNYSGLVVLDADGCELPARLDVVDDHVAITVDDTGARYPLTIDPIAQQAYLKASNTGAYDLFGSSVAASGDTVVVGARSEGSNATGVNGDQNDNSAPNSGAAYVFVRNGTTWSQQAYLKASNTGENDRFGGSVAVSGDTVVVGAVDEDSIATGVNGNQSDNTATSAGAAYVFVRSGTTWSQQAYLKASNPNSFDYFGTSVAVSRDTVVVGAEGEDSNATGVNGDQTDNSSISSGAAYVFTRSGTTWSQQAYLKASNTDLIDNFGNSVALSRDTVVVGAVFESSNATGVNGDQSDNSATASGAAYVFVRSGTSWSQQAYMKASNTDPDDNFGRSVSAFGDTVVVGASNESSSATGVNGNQTDNSASRSGAAYVFARSGTTWTQQAYLKASNTGTFDSFGWSVTVSGDTVAVGAYLESSSATGVNGNQNDDSAGASGAAYVFTRSDTTWSQLAYLKASNTESLDEFGSCVAVSGATVVVGALGEDSNDIGVNGDQGDNSAAYAGAAYVFSFRPWTDQGAGQAGTSGIPALDGSGTLVAGSPGSLSLSSAAPSAASVLFISLASTPAAFECASLEPTQVAIQIPLLTDGSGAITLPWASWPSALSGTTLTFQCAIQDAAAPGGVALSNALRADAP